MYSKNIHIYVRSGSVCLFLGLSWTHAGALIKGGLPSLIDLCFPHKRGWRKGGLRVAIVTSYFFHFYFFLPGWLISPLTVNSFNAVLWHFVEKGPHFSGRRGRWMGAGVWGRGVSERGVVHIGIWNWNRNRNWDLACQRQMFHMRACSTLWKNIYPKIAYLNFYAQAYKVFKVF